MRVFIRMWGNEQGFRFKPIISSVELRTKIGNFVLDLNNPIVGLTNYNYEDGYISYYFSKANGDEILVLNGIADADQSIIDDMDNFTIYICSEELVPYIERTVMDFLD